MGGERGTMRMGWMWTKVMAMTMGGAMKGQHGEGYNKMSRKTTKDEAGRRVCA